MKKSFILGLFSICLLSFLLLSVTDTVKADDSTETPTPTLTPSATPTYQPLIDLEGTPEPKDYSCPPAIQGYGTVTPSAKWMLYCSDCLHDIQWASTMAVDESPTPIPQPTLEPGIYVGDPLIMYLEVETPGNSTAYGTTDTVQFQFQDEVVAYVYGWWNLVGPTGSFPKKVYMDACVQVEEGTNLHCLYQNTYNGPAKSRIVYDPSKITEQEVQDLLAPLAVDTAYSRQQVIQDTTIWFRGVLQVTSYYEYEIAHANYMVIPIYYGVPSGAEPQATPTPAYSDGYCGSIEEEGTQQADDSLPIMMVGEGQCVTFNGWTLDFTTINWLSGFDLDVLVIPGFQLCVSPIYFGQIQILGLKIQLDMIAGLMGSVAILRWFIRS